MSADDFTTTIADEPREEQSAPSATPGAPLVSAPANAVEESPVHEPEVETDTDSVPAQVTGPSAEPVTSVPVHETRVSVDKVITDPSDPLAVQVPPEGRGNALTPIGGAWGVETPETPEEALARKASESDDE